MDFNLTSAMKDVYNLDELYEQVKAQSHHCDFTITMGSWSKRFHSCVLVRAGFFDCLLNNEFQEKLKGSVDITVGGSAANITTAIEFLYGRYLTITTDNIGDLLELAEFLFIPHLKAILVRWLQNQTVSKGTIMQFLKLASLYEFDLPKCYNYICANLDTCFENTDFILITKESATSLLSDATLLYVRNKSKFRFVLNWLQFWGPASSNVVKEWITLIDMETVSKELIREARNDPVFQKCNIPIDTTRKQSEYIPVLLMKHENRGIYLAYDLKRSLWFRITSPHLDQIRSKVCSFKSKVVLNKLESFRLRKDIPILDIATKSITKTTLVDDVYGEDLSRATICYSNGMAWAVLSKKVDLHKRHFFRSKHVMKYYNTLYMGVLSTDSKVTKMAPVLSYPIENMRNVCVNESNCIASYGNNNELYVFDANVFTLHVKRNVSNDLNTKLCPTRSGFIIHDNYIVKDITVSPRFNVRKIDLPTRKLNKLYRYFFVENYWVRLDNMSGSAELVSHDDLKLCSRSTALHLPWPPEQVDQSPWRPITHLIHSAPSAL